jgi:hypothetical protein
MYQKIHIECQPAYVPVIGKIELYDFKPSTYFIRGIFSRGHFAASSFYSRLGGLELEGKIKNLHVYSAGNAERVWVFLFDAPHSLDVIKLFVALNELCALSFIPPLPDLEFVHPAAHALLYSLGGFSGGSADCYLNADPDAVDLNQKVR